MGYYDSITIHLATFGIHGGLNKKSQKSKQLKFS